MPVIGILFDIDELGGSFYGKAAWKIFFEVVDTRNLRGCSLSHGDTARTLAHGAREYCIAVESDEISVIESIRDEFSRMQIKDCSRIRQGSSMNTP